MNESSKRNWSPDEIMEQSNNDPNKRSRIGPAAAGEEEEDKDVEDKRSMILKELKPVIVEEGEELDDQNRNFNISSRGHLIRTSAAGSKQGRWRCKLSLHHVNDALLRKNQGVLTILLIHLQSYDSV